MVKSKIIFKRTLAILLAIIFVTAIPLSVNADTVTVNSMPQCIDSNGQYMKYAQNAYSSDSRKVCEQGNPIWTIYIGAAVDKNRAYCIEPGGALSRGNTLDTSDIIWKNFSRELQKSINLTLLYGLNGSPDKLVGNSDEKYIATQLIIWELIDGYRNFWNSNNSFQRTNAMYYDAVCSNGANSNVAKNYKLISDSLGKYSTLPSFANKYSSQAHTLTLNWDGSKYTTTVTDTNNVLDQFNFSAEGITFTQNGNKLTISTDKFIDDTAVASSRKTLPEADVAAKLVAYGSPDRQDVVTGVESESDPPMAYFKLETSEAKLKIVKRDKETKEIIPLQGFGFKITDSKGNYLTDGNTDTWYTDITGSVSLPLMLDIGTYYIEEVKAAGDYEVNPDKLKVTLDGESPVVVVDFYDKVQKGEIKIKKTGGQLDSIKEVKLDDGTVLKQPVWSTKNEPLADASFQLIAAEDIVTQDGTIRYKKGDTVVDEKVSDSNGELTFTDLYFGKYTIKEIKAPYGYYDSNQTVTAEINKDNPKTEKEVVNYKRRLKVQLTKALEQDEANLINIKEEVKKVSYGLYANSLILANDSLDSDGIKIRPNDLLDIAYANSDGTVEFNIYLPVGTYYTKELTTSEHYVLDDTKHYFAIDKSPDPDTETLSYKNIGTFENKVTTVPVTARKVAADTEKPLAGAEIEVYSENKSLVYTGTSNADGYFENFPQLIKGTYTYKEITAPTGYLLDENTYTFDVNGDEEFVEITLKDELVMGKVEISKTGEIFSSVTTNTDENGTTTYIPNFKDGSLEGAKFEIVADGDIITPDGTIRYKDGEVAAELTTGKDGTAAADSLYLGNYIIKEVEAPKGYTISFDEIKITLSVDYTFVTTDPIENVRNKVNVKLHKELEADKNDLVDVNAEIKKSVAFGIFADEKITGADGSFIPENGLIEKLYCDENGDIIFSADLPNGKFYVQEMETSRYYILDDTKHCFEVDNSKELTIEIGKDKPIINKLITKPVEIKKVAKDTGLPLAGAEIEISTPEGKVIYTGITQADGKLEGIPELPIGTYNYRELTAPQGYQLDTYIYTFEVTGNEDVIELTLENEIILGKITVVKTGERFAEVKKETSPDGTTTYKPEYREGSLEGAEFEVIAKTDIITPDGTLRYSEGDIVETIVTGADGTATSSNLYLGTYLIKETKAPNEFDISEEVIEETLSDKNNIITTQPVSNSRHKVNISLKKTMETDKWNIIDTKKEVTKVAFGVFANEDIFADNGSYIPMNGLVEKANCDENGNIKFTASLPFGSFYVKEIETSEFYVLDDTKHHFIVDTQSDINIDLNETGEFYNQWDKTQIDFKKAAKDTSSPLAGCEIEIKHKNGTIVYKGVTGANGKLPNVPQLPHGTYTYKEITAPTGYLLDGNTYSFTVDGSKKVIELVMEDTPIVGGIEITKSDIATDRALPDCGIRLLDANGNVLLEKKTDSNGKVLFDNLKVGKYYYQEFDAPDGYQINTNKFPFEIKENGVIIKAVLKDEKIKTESPTTPTKPNTPVTPNTPEAGVTTGQTVHMSAFITTLLISAGIIIAAKKKINYIDK